MHGGPACFSRLLAFPSMTANAPAIPPLLAGQSRSSDDDGVSSASYEFPKEWQDGHAPSCSNSDMSLRSDSVDRGRSKETEAKGFAQRTKVPQLARLKATSRISSSVAGAGGGNEGSDPADSSQNPAESFVRCSVGIRFGFDCVLTILLPIIVSPTPSSQTRGALA